MVNMKRRNRETRPSMRKRLFYSLGSLAVILLVSGIISILEYRRMSDYMSELITSNSKTQSLIHAEKFSGLIQEYNDNIVELLAEEDSLIIHKFVLEPVLSKADSLITSSNQYDDTSVMFDEVFYRSMMPGVVSVGAGILLIFLLFYFTMSNYVNPLCRMSDGIDQYRQTGHRYSGTFDGDDQLANINAGITELIEENIELKKRIKALKDER
jgi:hypothetical protein